MSIKDGMLWVGMIAGTAGMALNLHYDDGPGFVASFAMLALCARGGAIAL